MTFEEAQVLSARIAGEISACGKIAEDRRYIEITLAYICEIIKGIAKDAENLSRYLWGLQTEEVKNEV